LDLPGPSIRDICRRDNPIWVKPDEKLPFYSIAKPELLGPICSHVTAANNGRPLADFLQSVGQDNDPFDRHERIWGAVVLDAQSSKEGAGKILTLHGVSAGIKEDVPVVVGDEPHGSDM